jgi:ATP-binding cassette subfamily B protein
MSLAEFVIDKPYRTRHDSPRRWVVSHVLRHWYLIPLILLGAFGNAALAGIVPVATGRAFDAINADQADKVGVLVQAALIIGISQVIRAVLQLGRNFGSELLGQRLERDIRDELYASLLGKSMTFHGLQPVGDTMARATNDVREVNLMFNPGVNLVVGSANFLIIPVLYSLRYDPRLAFTPLAFIILYFFAIRGYLRTLAPITEEARSAFGHMNARLTEAIEGIEVVKSGAQEEAETAGFEENAAAYRAAFVRQGEQEARFLPLLLLGLASGTGLLHSLLLYSRGILEVGDVVAYMGLLQLFGFPVFVSLWAYSQVSSGMASANRILELITRRTELGQNPEGYSAAIVGAIEFDKASFEYVEGSPVLHDVSFRVAPGQLVAVVGQTGAGKTSIARLINRTYDTTGGVVKIDGIDVCDWHLESLRRGISIIEQDVFLFSRTVAQNIAFGCPDATREQIEAAAAQAQAHDFILRLPEGYDTIIGERGVTLSGGQRQRLAIARALLTDPGILIIDDATSAIDSATEDKIQGAIQSAAAGRTTVLITHRLSQIRRADLVIVLRQGRVSAAGRHEELIADSPSYRRIFVQLGQLDGGSDGSDGSGAA